MEDCLEVGRPSFALVSPPTGPLLRAAEAGLCEGAGYINKPAWPTRCPEERGVGLTASGTQSGARRRAWPSLAPHPQLPARGVGPAGSPQPQTPPSCFASSSSLGPQKSAEAPRGLTPDFSSLLPVNNFRQWFLLGKGSGTCKPEAHTFLGAQRDGEGRSFAGFCFQETSLHTEA